VGAHETSGAVAGQVRASDGEVNAGSKKARTEVGGVAAKQDETQGLCGGGPKKTVAKSAKDFGSAR
jgi:hypothetical protein